MAEQPLIDRIVAHKQTVIKEEKRNIRLVSHACLSAYTDNPINVAIVAASSEGKTYLAKNTVDMFPATDVEILQVGFTQGIH